MPDCNGAIFVASYFKFQETKKDFCNKYFVEEIKSDKWVAY